MVVVWGVIHFFIKVKLMPTSPPNKRPAYLQKKTRQPTSDQSFYGSKLWRKTRKQHIYQNPLCEVHLSLDKYVDCTFGGHVDHITPTEQGGALLDDRNLMTLCPSCHNRKSGIEMHEKCLVQTTETVEGLIPAAGEKEKVIERLAKYLV